MKSHHIPFLAIVLFMSSLLACQGGKTDPEEPETPPAETGIQAADLVGEWVSSGLRVQIKSMGGAEGDTVIEATEDNYLEVLGIKANFSNLLADGTFEDVYHMPNDSLERGNGKWSVSNDSLTFIQIDPGTERTHVYKVEISDDNILTVTGYVDFDGDGEKDDLFTGTSYKRQ